MGTGFYGRLAQLVEHLLDVQGVRDSSSLPPTMKTTKKRRFLGGFVVSFGRSALLLLVACSQPAGPAEPFRRLAAQFWRLYQNARFYFVILDKCTPVL